MGTQATHQLYNIENTIQALLYALCEAPEDADTSEMQKLLSSYEKLKEAALAGTCAFIKNGKSTIEAVQNEITRLKGVVNYHKVTTDRAEQLLARSLEGQAWTNGMHSASWKRSTSVEVTNEELLTPEFIREKVVREPNKIKLGEVLKSGATVEGAHLVEKINLQLK